MDAIQVLEDVLAKTVKNTSNENRIKAASALKVLYQGANNHEQVVDYIVKFHYTVCLAFLDEFCKIASASQIAGITEALLNNEQFKNGNPDNILYPKGLSAVFVFLNKEKYQSAFLILNKILSTAESTAKKSKSGNFSDACIKNFKKFITDKNKLQSVLELRDRAADGTIQCKTFEHQRLARFLKVLENETPTTVDDGKPKPLDYKTGQTNNSGLAANPKPSLKSDETDRMSRFEKVQLDILNSVRKLTENRTSIDTLSTIVTQKDKEINSLRDMISQKERRISELNSAIIVKDKQISEFNAQVDDLTQKLRTSLQMDDISNNQELVTLKNDISEALILEYADFLKTKDSQCSEDMFIAYRSTLSRIFKLLRRYGIPCQ